MPPPVESVINKKKTSIYIRKAFGGRDAGVPWIISSGFLQELPDLFSAYCPWAQNQEPFNDVAKLADVAGPRLPAQQIHCLRADFSRLLAHPGRNLFIEITDQLRDILFVVFTTGTVYFSAWGYKIVLSNFLCIQNLNLQWQGLNGVTWTVALMVQFYLVSPLI